MFTVLVKQLKHRVLYSIRAAGGFQVLKNSTWRGQKLLILGYHGIAIDDEHKWNPSLYMPQDLFRERMRMLKDGSYNVLPLNDAVTRLYSGSLPPRAVSLTFDDGCLDFRLRALPVLLEYGFPASVYLTTYYAINRYPVFNVFFSYLLWKCERHGADRSRLIQAAADISIPDNAGYPMLREHILKWMREQKPSHEQQAKLAQQIAAAAGLNYDHICRSGILQVMGPEDIAEIANHNVTIELHTHRHRTPRDELLFRREIRENRDHIMRMTPTQPRPVHFCYPSGNYVAEFFPWLQTEGVQSATTCKSGLATAGDIRFELPRLIDTCNISGLEFEGWLTGASHLLPRRS